MHTLILGAGYSGRQIAVEAARFGTVCGTRRTREGVAELASLNIPGCVLNDAINDQILAELSRVTHLVVSVAPQRELPLNDPMLKLLGPLTPAGRASPAGTPFSSLQWIGYLSTIGVYGDHGGEWVDETTACNSTQTRSLARREAELAWQAMAREWQVPVSILRLSGIYGPGRNAVADAIVGRAHMLIKPGQYFNRIHVEDLARATLLAAQHRYDGVLNITDELPAAPQDVIRHAHELVGKPAPEARDFATADISPMARSFYSENKRVRNDLSKQALRFEYRYPDYRAGLGDIWRGIQQRNSRDS
ncbi:NAD-dependent epimerase/dehydratase family protein [Granulosicoccus sp. 3-233]|uniref:NAD-dependent epimerase/dehydratase family protein n=1 Tax=Granulosicoccus sp. 3-233 TaxID=3417969 RepID=UPI003D32A522